MKTAPTLLAASLLASLPLAAADWPQWLGPNRNNVAPADAFDGNLSQWKVAWKTNVGLGYSAVTVAANRAYTLGHDGKGNETIVCLDATRGDVLWKHSYPAELLPKMHSGGPNATATVHGNRVFTLGKDGHAFCLDADSGKVVWQSKLTELGHEVPMWGFASSPVIDGSRLLLLAGRVTALNLDDGKLLWTSKAQSHPGYSTAVVFTRDGRRFIAAHGGKELCILAADDGAEVTRRTFKVNFDVIATTPYALAQGTRLLISGNTGAELLDFDGAQLTPVWTSSEAKTALNNSVPIGDTLYALDGRQGSTSTRLVALDISNGKPRWTQPNFGYGSVIGVGTALVALTESGEIVAARATPDRYHELGRQQILSKTCWTPPTFGNNRIYARNDKGDLVCLSSK